MTLDRETIEKALDTELATFVARRAKDAAGSDPLRLEWWFLNFGIAWTEHGLTVRGAADVADVVLIDHPTPPPDDVDGATDPGQSRSPLVVTS